MKANLAITLNIRLSPGESVENKSVAAGVESRLRLYSRTALYPPANCRGKQSSAAVFGSQRN